MRRAGSIPARFASPRRLLRTSAPVSRSHRTLPGTAARRRIQIANTSGSILYEVLKQQNTNPDSGSPQAARVAEGPGEADAVDLDRRRPQRKDALPGGQGITVAIDEDRDAIPSNALRDTSD